MTRWIPALLAMFSLTLRLAILFHADFMFDDPYITWRVARNLANGLGAVYNVGDHVQASSSLLHTWFCAALWLLFDARALFIDRVCACFVDAACTFLIASHVLALDEHKVPRSELVIGAVAGGLFHALSAQSAFVAPAGLETSFYCCAVLVACLQAGRGKFGAASLAGCLAISLRPDGYLALIVVVLFAIRRRAFKPVLVTCALLLLPLVLVQWTYYGTLIPQTVTAKRLIERSTIDQWLTLLNEFFIGGYRQRGTTLLVLLGATQAWQVRALKPLLLWSVAYAVVFSTIGSWWPWYWAPLAVSVALLLGLGAARICELLGRLRLPRSAVIGVMVAGCLAMAVSLGQHTWRRTNWGRAFLGPIKRQNIAMAGWVEHYTRPDANILTERIGEFGFHITRRIDDYPGLVSARVTNALRTLGRPIAWGPSDSQALAVILRRVAPTHLLLRRAEYDAAVRAQILPCYEIVHAFPAEGTRSVIADYQEMLALERRCRD